MYLVLDKRPGWMDLSYSLSPEYELLFHGSRRHMDALIRDMICASAICIAPHEEEPCRFGVSPIGWTRNHWTGQCRLV